MGKPAAHDFVQTLRGQKLRFPNLNSLVVGWQKGCSPHLKTLREVQHKELFKLLGPGKAYDICESTDCPYWAAHWWPNASWDALRFAAQVATFLYVWDDEMDTPELSDISTDMEAGNRFRDASILHFERYLADNPPPGNPADPALPPALKSFNPLGEATAFRMTRGQRLKVLSELYRFVHAVENEQESELSGKAPTLEEYLPRRMGTSAAGFVMATLEYMIGIDLGETIRYDADIVVIFEAAVCMIALMNDLFSLRRELRYPFYNNIVAVLYNQHRDLQKCVDETFKILQHSSASIEAASQRVLARYPERHDDLSAWINGTKVMITGNMTWSMSIKRYSLGIADLDGNTEITI